jgi:hypothetical protein
MESDQVVVGIPGAKGRPWHAKEKWPAIGGLLVGGLAAGGAFTKEATSRNPSGLQIMLLLLAILGGALLGLTKISQSVHKDAKEDKKESPDDLRGCLYVIHRTLAGYKRTASPPVGWLRATVHRVDGAQLEQSVDYVGSSDLGGGRFFSINTGLIGAVARRGEPMKFARPADMGHEEWLDYLVEHLGMTTQQARATSPRRYSFLGVPIKNRNGAVIGVVYLDAAAPDFFDDTAFLIILSGCEGLADWVHERYGT